MRVLLVAHNCQSPTEGQPKARCLAAMPDMDLQVLVPDRWCNYGRWRSPAIDPDLAGRVRVGKVRWPWMGPGQCYLHWYPRFAQIVREFQPDIIDMFEEPWGLVSAHACWVRDRIAPRARIVSETEQNMDKRLPPPFEHFRRYVLGKADFVVARSSEAGRVTRRKGYDGPVEVVPNAVDADLFRPMNRQACRKHAGVSGFVVGYVGRLVARKGLFDLLEAVAQTPGDINLLLVGNGEMEPTLRNRADELKLGERLRIVGKRPLDELPSIMNAIDVLALPSRTVRSWKEQFGRVIIEAHACGTPVIGSDSGAIPEVVGGGGLIFPEGDATALAKAIMSFRDGTYSRDEMGKVGREVVLEKYTWQRVAAQMHNIFRRVLT